MPAQAGSMDLRDYPVKGKDQEPGYGAKWGLNNEPAEELKQLFRILS